MFEDRRFAVETPMFWDVLRFTYLQGTDHISRPFDLRLGLASENFDIEASALLGKPFLVRLGEGLEARFFHAFASEFRFDRFESGFAHYEVRLRPWLWFLSNTTDNRIFQNMSAVEIIEEVFSAYPEAIYDKRFQNSYAAREYCVQYGESDLDFVQRLMEDEGIFYFFEHDGAGHTLVMCDANAKLDGATGLETIRYLEDAYVTFRDGDFITQWQPRRTVVTGGYVQTDYDFEKPGADLATKSVNPRPHDQNEGERYDYPGRYTEIGPGDRRTLTRLEEVQATSERAAAATTAPAFWSGQRFKLEGFPRDAENDDYLIVSVRYDAWDDQYRSGRRQAERPPEGYEAHLVVAPISLPFRPDRTTPRPVMKGPQTATVVGPAGAEIFTDSYSRVKVQFHWDRLGGNDENSSCFVRVSSVWAGAGWGFIQIPRIGQEVIVDFLEGDPDQPLITGRVYNAAQMPPYELPANATQSGWKSNSSPGGGGWNELRFEDKKGEEEVYFQAEKDHNEWIKNDESRTIDHDFSEDVGNDATQSVGHDRSESVGNDKDTTVGNNRVVKIGTNDTESVGVDRSLTVGANETISVGSNSTETIGVNHTQTVGATQTVSVGAARIDTVGAAETRNVGGAQVQSVGSSRSVNVGASQSHNVGGSDSLAVGGDRSADIAKTDSTTVGTDQSLQVGEGRAIAVGKSNAISAGEDIAATAGKNVVVEAGDSITLKCGKASVTLKKDGTIVLDGKDIAAKGSGKVQIKASGDVTIKGSKINQN